VKLSAVHVAEEYYKSYRILPDVCSETL